MPDKVALRGGPCKVPTTRCKDRLRLGVGKFKSFEVSLGRLASSGSHAHAGTTTPGGVKECGRQGEVAPVRCQPNDPAEAVWVGAPTVLMPDGAEGAEGIDGAEGTEDTEGGATLATPKRQSRVWVVGVAKARSSVRGLKKEEVDLVFVVCTSLSTFDCDAGLGTLGALPDVAGYACTCTGPAAVGYGRPKMIDSCSFRTLGVVPATIS